VLYLQSGGEVRPIDLAREHGISTQAVRNYENAGFIPRAQRTHSGYRVYTDVHAAALRAYLSLVAAYGHEAGGQIMADLNDSRIDHALETLDRGHQLLLRDRSTLKTVKAATMHLDREPTADLDRHRAASYYSIGDLARRLDLTPAALRNWEDAGILTPHRDPATGHRIYRADDVRDAELAHLLRRGGYLLDDIATVTTEVRTVGGTSALNEALDTWQHKLTARGLAMLTAAAHLADYVDLMRTSHPDVD